MSANVVTLPFETSAEMASAAMFLASLQSNGLAFEARVIDSHLVITITGY